MCLEEFKIHLSYWQKIYNVCKVFLYTHTKQNKTSNFNFKNVSFCGRSAWRYVTSYSMTEKKNAYNLVAEGERWEIMGKLWSETSCPHWIKNLQVFVNL